MKIYCCGCEKDIEARLTDGKEIYPHRVDLGDLPFWKCDICKNHVGCHHKTANRTKPLGNIATKEIKVARMHIHILLDPLWVKDTQKRNEVYKKVSDFLGYPYHTAEIKSIEEARKIYRFIKTLQAVD